MSDESSEVWTNLAEERDLAAASYPMEELLRELSSGKDARMVARGDAWLALLIAELSERLKRPIAVVAPGMDQARGIYDGLESLASLGERAILLPPPDVSPFV